MKRQKNWIVAAMLALALIAPSTSAGTAFTYQGLLKSGGAPADGTYHLRFTLWTSLTSGVVAGPPLDLPTINIVDGLFTADLDFGAGAFSGGDRFLEVAVIIDDGATVITLAPRQPITPAPYAIFAQKTAPLTTALFPTGGSWALSSGLNLDSGTLHVDPANNRVGIGTAAPASTLHVVGNTTLTGDVAVAGVASFANMPTFPTTTRTLSLNPAEFELLAGSSAAFRLEFLLYSTVPQNNVINCVAPLSLPDGAVITNVTFVVKDFDETKTMTCSLSRDDTAVGAAAQTSTTIGSGLSVSPTSTIQGVSISGLPVSIDNTGHSYALGVSWPASSSSSSMGLLRVEVTYTITAPLP